ncbi:MAG: TIGR03364 family FAD-dependent oxidoreductase [Gemmataceae bacterium]
MTTDSHYKMQKTWDLVVVGSGILGIFHAYHATRLGLRTLLLEKDSRPLRASVRNFGMIIPSGMPVGDWHRRGEESSRLYQSLSDEIGFPICHRATQYLASTPEELKVIHEFAELGPDHGYHSELLDREQSLEANSAIHPDYCLGSILFHSDLRIDPRVLVNKMVNWLSRQQTCSYSPRTMAIKARVEGTQCRVTTADGTLHVAAQVCICNGSDLRILFPEKLAERGLVACKLLMLRTTPQRTHLQTSLASGLSIRRYASFRLSPSWKTMQESPVSNPALTAAGIHILAVQDQDRRIVLGDSHEYSQDDMDDHIDANLERLILSECRRMLRLSHWEIDERWHGLYTSWTDGELFEETIDGRIHIVTGIGGKGMTTSPALARERIERIFR